MSSHPLYVKYVSTSSQWCDVQNSLVSVWHFIGAQVEVALWFPFQVQYQHAVICVLVVNYGVDKICKHTSCMPTP